MPNRDVDCQEAAETFVSGLTSNATARCQSILKELEQDGGKWHPWFLELDEESREIVREIISATGNLVLFGVLCKLDGVTARWRKDCWADLALHYQEYEDQQMMVKNKPTLISARINTPTDRHLHDLVPRDAIRLDKVRN